MKIKISNGELLDKISILELKMLNITDKDKLVNINNEFNELNPFVHDLFDKYGPEIQELYLNLSKINGQLWTIEDDIRECERCAQFGDVFVELARSVYITNDKRCDVKKEINILIESGLIEEKSYEKY